MMASIAKQLKDARSRRKMSQRKAAEGAGISFVHLCNIEHGKGSPTVGLLSRLARVYKTRFVIDGSEG